MELGEVFAAAVKDWGNIVERKCNV